MFAQMMGRFEQIKITTDPAEDKTRVLRLPLSLLEYCEEKGISISDRITQAGLTEKM